MSSVQQWNLLKKNLKKCLESQKKKIMSKPFGEGSLKMKAIKVNVLTVVLIAVLSFSLIDLCHGEKNRQMTASVDVGRAKAKISAEEMLKLHRKRRDENDKLFSINSPRKNDPENQVNKDFLYLSK